jgi:osmotically-inducible protein OsmY
MIKCLLEVASTLEDDMQLRAITTLPALVFCLLCSLDIAAGQDQGVQAAIEKDFEKEKIKGVNIEIREGTIILSGRPRNCFVRDRALEIALAHVEEVENTMEIATPESEKELGEQVVDAIRRYNRLEIFDDVNGYIEEGRVELVGWVTEPYKSRDIEKRMHNVLGIQEFENKIEVLPVSQLDASLRIRLAKRIYSDSLFEAFASMVHPPIRIIVKNSRVLLTGVVRGQLERQKALSLARSTQGVLSVEDRLRTER